MQQHRSRIISAGYHFPTTVIPTRHILEEASKSIGGLDANIIEQQMGIYEVRHSDHHEKPSHLALQACNNALNKANIERSKIDFIIYCGVEGDYTEPSTAHAVQAGLELQSVCFDIQNACLGFATGLQLADSLIATRSARYVLVCTGEKLSNLTKAVLSEIKRKPEMELFKKKLGFMAVGDAGGAALIGPATDGSGFHSFIGASRGKLAELCYYRMQCEQLDGQMVMDRITAQAIKAHRDLFQKSLKQLKWQPSKINCLITHQVGKRLFERLSQVFSVDHSRMTKSYEKYGNIATATFPVNYAQALESGKISPGDNVFCGLSGSGLTICQIGLKV